MNGDVLLISLYVDDIIYTSSSSVLLAQFKIDMMNTFKMTDLGLMSYFLGIEVKQNSEGFFISQQKYIEDLLVHMNMKLCKPVSTPLAVNEKLEEGDSDKFSDPGTYRSLIGKLLYVTHTRPDIVFPVNYLSRFMNQPSKIQFIVAKRVVRYLAGTKTLGLWYSRGDDGELEAFSDSDWGGSKADRKSTSGVFIKLGSCPISWGSRKQDVVPLSTTEVEYIASTGAACQVDNLSAIAVAKNPADHGRTKHIDVRYHFIRGLVSEGVISLYHCSTEDHIADIFTKPLLTEKFVMFRSLLGMRSSQSRGDVDAD
ncbi:uncharacterized mitochondrial protein AtMg00810-like [Dioscorea cayenensis subsp. rotundata]|uniref:Uncharacterized mitochondrial protein AtMg00810-like n=1 Tax=Dioscorea cayennensis subsp. rotundata TaxID=55577 RepID=A0AB40BRP1_DIOCR|nr:uncharacterized mitochondrial protein AtMg00810-like [Dioscorea cayenensis subsp. rotundata]